jgi:hypothetical protein
MVASSACDDGVANGDEEHTDCGGSCPAACVPGCTANTTNTTNFNPSANVDDGSCEFLAVQCTDPKSTTYNPAATTDYPQQCKYECETIAALLSGLPGAFKRP